MKKILITTSTLPASDTDPVPAFVKDQTIWLKKIHPELEITLLAPHNAYSNTRRYTAHKAYTEYRFHYFLPRWELVTGRGIAPALKKNKLLYFELPFLILAEFFATYRYVKKLKPDLLYAHWFTPQAITAALVSKLTGVPFVFTSHSSDVIVLKKVPFAKKVVAAVCRQARAYTAVSTQTSTKLLHFATPKTQQVIEAKLHLIPMGTTFTAPTQKAINTTKDTYGLHNKKILLFIGRLASIKGVNYLLEAFVEINKAHPNTCLVIAGDGQEKMNLETFAKKLGLYEDRVIFTGYVSGTNKEGLLGAADILCIPSIKEGDHSEGLPVVFMEGVGLGKIVAASDVSGTQEYIKSGENGFLFPQRDSKALAAALSQIVALSAEETTAVQQSALKLAKRFDWETVAREHYEFFNHALQSR